MARSAAQAGSKVATESGFTGTLAADAQALRAATASVPGIDATAQALQEALQAKGESAPAPASDRRGRLAGLARFFRPSLAEGRLQPEPTGDVMKSLYPLPARSRIVTFGLATALLAGVLLWPVSYERTIGHTITLELPAASTGAGVSGPGGPSPEQVRGLATRLKQAVGAGAVRVAAGGPGAPVVLTARVPTRSRRDVERQLAGLTAALTAEHIAVAPRITARTEHHTGRVYAMALDRLIDIRVDTTGKTDSQVETEIRDQLTRSGVTPDSVQFQRTGSDESEANISAHDGSRELRIVRRQKGASGELHIEAGGLDTERTPGMTDDELRDKIARQLAARGMTATVTVNGDEIQVRGEKTVAP